MKISIRSTDVLSVLGMIAVGLMLWVEFTKREMEQPYFEEKMVAAKTMAESINYLKNKHFKNEISIDNINDPNDSKLIGTQYSQITSGKGSLPIKLSTINPNLAALVVEFFKDAEIKKGDHIGICATGSFPALNIAVCTAAEVLGLKVSFIGSVTSSSWGANDPIYTYLDMHSSLIEGGFLKQQMIASSIGGNDDLGKTLSAEGRTLAVAAIHRNKLEIINERSLSENIKRRMELFRKMEQQHNQELKAFVNIGGGIASLGSAKNSITISSGLLKNVKLGAFPDKQGVIFAMASNNKKVINLLNLSVLLNRYNLPFDPIPLPEAGSGELFYKLKYDYRFVGVSLFTLISILVFVIMRDKKQNALGKNIIYEKNETSNGLSDSF